MSQKVGMTGGLIEDGVVSAYTPIITLSCPKSSIGQFHIFSTIKSNEPSSNELYSSKCICVPQGTSFCAKFSK